MNKAKVFKLAKGFRGRAKNCIRIARERVEKALQYSYRDRRNKKRDMRSLWIQRINAGTRIHSVRSANPPTAFSFPLTTSLFLLFPSVVEVVDERLCCRCMRLGLFAGVFLPTWSLGMSYRGNEFAVWGVVVMVVSLTWELLLFVHRVLDKMTQKLELLRTRKFYGFSKAHRP